MLISVNHVKGMYKGQSRWVQMKRDSDQTRPHLYFQFVYIVGSSRTFWNQIIFQSSLDIRKFPCRVADLLGRLVKRLDIKLRAQRNDPLGVVLRVRVEVVFLDICLSAVSDGASAADIRSKLVVSLKAALFQYNLLSQSCRYGKSCRTDD